MHVEIDAFESSTRGFELMEVGIHPGVEAYAVTEMDLI